MESAMFSIVVTPAVTPAASPMGAGSPDPEAACPTKASALADLATRQQNIQQQIGALSKQKGFGEWTDKFRQMNNQLAPLVKIVGTCTEGNWKAMYGSLIQSRLKAHDELLSSWANHQRTQEQKHSAAEIKAAESWNATGREATTQMTLSNLAEAMVQLKQRCAPDKITLHRYDDLVAQAKTLQEKDAKKWVIDSGRLLADLWMASGSPAAASGAGSRDE